MLGFFPPSSRAIFLNMGAAVRAISAPVIVPPVNDNVRTFGCFTSAAPALAPRPCTMLRTPAGSPAFWHNSPSKYAVIGVISEGFATAVLPHASAGAIFQVSKYSGRFQGEI